MSYLVFVTNYREYLTLTQMFLFFIEDDCFLAAIFARKLWKKVIDLSFHNYDLCLQNGVNRKLYLGRH